MPQDKLPIKDFAAKIKAKYPQYASVADDVLVQKIVAKYPEYEAQVDLAPLKKKEPQPQPSPKPGAPLNAGTPPISPSTSTSTSPLPLFGNPKKTPQDKIGQQVQKSEAERNATKPLGELEGAIQTHAQANNLWANAKAPKAASEMAVGGMFTADEYSDEELQSLQADEAAAKANKQAALKRYAPVLDKIADDFVKSGSWRSMLVMTKDKKGMETETPVVNTGALLSEAQRLSEQYGGGRAVREHIYQTLRSRVEYEQVKPKVESEFQARFKKRTGKTVEQYFDGKNAEALKTAKGIEETVKATFDAEVASATASLKQKSADTLTKYQTLAKGAKTDADIQALQASYAGELRELQTKENRRLARVREELLKSAQTKIDDLSKTTGLSEADKQLFNQIYGEAYETVLKGREAGKLAAQDVEAKLFGQGHVFGKSLWSGLNKWMAAKGSALVSIGINNETSDWLRGRQTVADEAQTIDKELSGANLLDPTTYTTRLGTQFGMQAPSLALTVLTRSPMLGGTAGMVDEATSAMGDVYDRARQEGFDHEEAAQKARQLFVEYSALLPLHVGESMFMIKGLKGAKAFGMATAGQVPLEIAQEEPQSFFEQAKSKYGKGVGQFVREDAADVALETSIMALGQSAALSSAGQMMSSLATSSKGTEDQFYGDIVGKYGENAAYAVAEQQYLNGVLDEKGLIAAKENIAKVASLSGQLQELGLDPNKRQAYVGLQGEIKHLQKQIETLTNSGTMDPSLLKVLQAQIQDREKQSKALMDGSMGVVVVTMPTGRTFAYTPQQAEKLLQEQSLVDGMANGDIKVTYNGETEGVQAKIEKAIASVTPKESVLQPAVILPGDNKPSETRTVAPKKEEKPTTTVIRPTQNKPAPVTTIAPKEVKTEAKADTRPTVILPSANKAPSVTTVSPQAPAAPPLQGRVEEAQRGEMQADETEEVVAEEIELGETQPVDINSKKGSFISEEEFNGFGYEIPSGLKGRGVKEIKPNGDNRFDVKLNNGTVLKDVLINPAPKREALPDNKALLTPSDKTQIAYGGKVQEVDVPFAQAAQRVSDNLKTGEIGYVKAPDGKVYEISGNSKKAKLLPETITPVSPQSPSPTPMVNGAAERGEMQAETPVVSEKVKVFRGTGKNVASGENSAVQWVAEDRRVAENYAEDGQVEELEIEKPKNPFEMPPNNIHVRGKDVGNRLRAERDKLFKAKKISREQAVEIGEAISKFEEAAGDDLELYSTKTNKQGAAEAFVNALKLMGFDGLVQMEAHDSASPFTNTKTGNESVTYGIFKEPTQPSDVSPQPPSPTPRLVESERGETQPQTLKVYRAGKKKGDVTFYSKTEAYAHEYNDFFLNGEAEVAAEDIAFDNPMVVELSDEEFTDINAQKPHITRAKKAGHDVVIFKNADPDGGYAGEEFYAVIKSNQGKKAESPISPSKKESERGALEEGETQVGERPENWSDERLTAEVEKLNPNESQGYNVVRNRELKEAMQENPERARLAFILRDFAARVWGNTFSKDWQKTPLSSLSMFYYSDVNSLGEWVDAQIKGEESEIESKQRYIDSLGNSKSDKQSKAFAEEGIASAKQRIEDMKKEYAAYQSEVASEKNTSPISPDKKETFREAILTALESANGSEFSEVISDIALQDSDRKTAVKNIRKGKSTVATRKVEEAIEKMWADGYVYLNRGRGDHAVSTQMPIAEFLERISQNDEAFQDLSRQAQNLQASLDALGEDLFTDAETIITEVNNESPQSNELKTPSTPSQDTAVTTTTTEGSNEANRTTGSPAPPVEGNKEQKTGVDRFEAQEVIPYRSVEDNTYKPEEQLKFNQGQYFEAVRLVGEPDLIELIQIGSRRHYNLTHSSGKKPVNEARQKQLEDQFGVSAYELYQKAREMAKANRSKTDEVIVVIGEKGSLAPKATPKQKKAGTYEAKARKLAQKLDNMKMPDWFSVKDPNVKKMGLDAESMKKAFKAIIIDTGILLDKGVEAGEALRRGAEAMVAFVEEGYKKIGGKLKPEAAEAIRAGFTRDAAQIFGITGDGTPPADATIEEDDHSNPTRRFSRRVLKDDTILKGVKPGVEAAMEYTRQTNAMSVQEASEVINRVGADDAYDLVVNDKGLKPAVRVVLGQMLIKKYNQMAEEAAAAGDTERENRYLDKTIDVANYVSEKFGTEAGQMIQALSLFERLTPEAQLRAAQKEVKAIGKKKAERRRKDIEEVGKKLQAANEEAVDELTQSPKVKKAVEKTESERVKKAKDKIEAARKKRENLIKKFRGDKGKNLYSTPGLTNEGIEFVGEMALTYLAEGVANVEIIADKILSEMKALSGKTPPEEVVRHVSDIVRGHVEKDRATKKAKGLKELEVEIGKVVREHYTVPSEKKTALIDKFMDRVGLDKAEATALAEEIQQEFDRIATRKKRALLETEKGRLAKIQKDLDRTEGRQPRELQDEIVRYSNLGALDSEEFFDMVAQKLGVGKLTAKEAKEIKALAERIQKAPEGSPRNEATQDLLAYRANLKGVNAMEVSQAVWYANILSGYKTHLVNIVSTFINGAGFFITEAARSPLSTPVLLYGAARGFHRGLFEAAYTVRTGRSPIHIKKVETPTTLERHQFYGLLYPLNWAKYVGRLMAAEDVVGFQSLKEMRATQLAWREARKQGLRNPFGRATWAHIEKTLLNTQERSDEAFEQAQKEGFENAGYKNRAAAAKTIAWKRRVYEIMELSRPVQMTEEAYGFAARGTFNHTPEGFLGALTNAITPVLDIEVNGMRPVRWVIPFTRIITNVVNANLDYTPVGFLRAWRGKRGAESFQNMSWTGGAYRELSREERLQVATKAALGILGTAALMALTYVEDEEGEPLIRITASGPEDFERQEQLRQTGWQPYSIKVGGKWYAYKWTPLVFNLSVLGYLKDQEAYGGDDEETQTYKVMLATFRTAQQIMDGTFVGSTSALMENLTTNQPSTAMDKTFGTGGKLISQTVAPNLYIQGAQALEATLSMNQKDAKNAFQRLQQHIPYARNMMNDKINALGEPIPTDVDVFVSPERTHPVFNFLHEKKAWVGRVNPNTFMIYDEQKGEERLGTPEEYYKFARLRGQKIKAEVENIMQNGAFVTYDENDKEVVTLNEDEARDVKPASQITSKEMKQLVRALSVRATKEAKEELFSPEW